MQEPAAGDMGSIPGSGRSLGEGNGNQLQYSLPVKLEQSGRLQSMRLQRVRQNLATEHTYMETQKTLNSQSNLEKEGQSWRCYTP